jgi:hypothetical protein
MIHRTNVSEKYDPDWIILISSFHSIAAFTLQWAATLHSYFFSLVNPAIDAVTLQGNFGIHHFFQKYTYNFWRQLDYEINEKFGKTHEQAISQVTSTLGLIRAYLTRYSDADEEGKLEILFYASAFHLQFLMRNGPNNHPDIHQVVQSLLPIMRRCKEQFGNGQETQLGQYLGGGQQDPGGLEIFTSSWWATLFDESPSGHNSPFTQSQSFGYSQGHISRTHSRSESTDSRELLDPQVSPRPPVFRPPLSPSINVQTPEGDGRYFGQSFTSHSQLLPSSMRSDGLMVPPLNRGGNLSRNSFEQDIPLDSTPSRRPQPRAALGQADVP